MVRVLPNATQANIERVAVAAKWQGCGAFRLLLSDCLTFLAALGQETATLRTRNPRVIQVVDGLGGAREQDGDYVRYTLSVDIDTRGSAKVPFS